MADYETVSEGSHCVRRDMFGQCIYTHNNFSKGNSRLYGMPEKEEKRQGQGGSKPFAPKPGPDKPLIPLNKVEKDGPDRFTYEGQIKERLTGTLSEYESDATHIMVATGMNQAQGDTPLGRARGRHVAQRYLDENTEPGKYIVDERSEPDFLLVRHGDPPQPDAPAEERGRNAVIEEEDEVPEAETTAAEAPDFRPGGIMDRAMAYVRGGPDPTANFENAPWVRTRAQQRAYEAATELRPLAAPAVNEGNVAGGFGLRRGLPGLAAGTSDIPEILEHRVRGMPGAIDDTADAEPMGFYERQAFDNTMRQADVVVTEREGVGGDSNTGTTRTGPTGRRRPDGPEVDRDEAPRDTEPRPAADVGRELAPVAEAPAEPLPRYTVGIPGSRTDVSRGAFWDWLGNTAALLGDFLKQTPAGKLLYNRGHAENEARINGIVDKINSLDIAPEQFHGMVGNSRGGSLSVLAASRLGPNFGGRVLARNAPPFSGQDEAGASLGDRLLNVRSMGDIATGIRGSLVHYLFGGALGKPPALTGGPTKTIASRGNALDRHMVGGPLDDVAKEAYLAGGQLAQMHNVRNHMAANPDGNIEDVETNLLDERQMAAMRGSAEIRNAEIARQQTVKDAADAGRGAAAERLRMYNEEPTRTQSFTKGFNSLNVNVPLAVGGLAAGFGAGIALDDLEDTLGIGKNAYYSRPAANAVATNALLEGIGSKFSGETFLSGLTGAGAVAAAGSALIGSGVSKLFTPKDGFTTTFGTGANMVGSGAVGGAFFHPLLKGSQYVYNAAVGSGGTAVEGGGAAAGGAAAEGGGAATAGTGGAIELAPMGPGGAATAGTAGEGGAAALAEGGGEALVEGGGAALAEGGGAALAEGGGAALAGAVATGGEAGAWAGPLGMLGGAAIGALFGGIGFLMNHSKEAQVAADNLERQKDKVKDEAIRKANEAKDKLRAHIGRVFGNLSAMDSQNLSQSALNTISAGVADPASFLG